jgi:hypothetical protein
MSEPPRDARRVSVPAARLARWLDGFADRHGALRTSATAEQVTVTAADGSIAWVEVPFPPFDEASPTTLTTLQRHVSLDRRIGVLLVRRGGYAAGVFEGRTLITSKVGSAYVQGTTKAGGWSQQRYARRRSNQARSAFAEAADVAARVLLPEADRLAALVCGGDRPAVQTVLNDHRLQPLLPLVLGPHLAVGDPKLKILQATPELFLVVSIAIYP